jgi:UDP-N-acetylmuramate dehydrogenase
MPAGIPDRGTETGLERAEAMLRQGGTPVRARFPLAPLTTFRIGGAAALYLEAQEDGDLLVAAGAVAATGIPWVVIGKGSNVLVADEGFPGLVLRLGKPYRWTARDGHRLRAGGAMPLPALAGVALTHSLAGLEFGVAIPASLGGAIRMNAGAHEHAVDEVVESIEVIRIPDGTRHVVAGTDAGFGYRRTELPAGSVVTGATVALRAGRPAEIRELMDEARAWRRATQPLAEPNCGSVFKNPPGQHAARLVEEAGAKGLSMGGAVVSDKHANFIVARTGATSGDIRGLIDEVRRRVRDHSGIELETEVQYVGS